MDSIEKAYDAANDHPIYQKALSKVDVDFRNNSTKMDRRFIFDICVAGRV